MMFGMDMNKKKTIHSIQMTAKWAASCGDGDGDYTPQVILFVAQFISGMGQPLYYTLGVSYMDDNIQKSKTPAFISEFQLNNIYFIK